MNDHELLTEAASNVLAKFEKSILEAESIKWISATVKNIKTGTEVQYDNAPGAFVTFSTGLSSDIGKTFEFRHHEKYPGIYGHYRPGYGFIWFHKDWLEFEKEGTPQNLFSQDIR